MSDEGGSTELVRAEEVPAEVVEAPVAVPAGELVATLGGAFGVPSREELRDLMAFSKVLVASGMFPDLQTVAQGIVKMVAGRAYGLDPVQSQQAFTMIQGRLSQAAKFQGALVKRSGTHDYRIERLTDQECRLEWLERQPDGEWRTLGHSAFTMEDAKRAGLGRSQSGKPGAWQMYPPDMLFARAVTRGATRFCAHLLWGPGFCGPGAAEDDDLDAPVEGEDQAAHDQPTEN